MTPTLDPSVRGNQTKQPARWARAKQWAELHPESKAGRTYLGRMKAAQEMAAALGDMPWHVLRKPYAWAGGGDPVYQYQVCSTVCMALQVQVSIGTGKDPVASLESWLAEVEAGRCDLVVEPRPATSKRRGACKCCGKDMV